MICEGKSENSVIKFELSPPQNYKTLPIQRKKRQLKRNKSLNLYTSKQGKYSGLNINSEKF